MTDAEKEYALRELIPNDIDVLGQGRFTRNAVCEALDRNFYCNDRPDEDDLAAELNLMLEAARDPREAAVDKKLAEFREGGK